MALILLVFFLLFVVTVIRDETSVRDFLRIFVSSSLSLVILLIIYIILGAMPQGRTLIVSVFESVISAILILFLVNFLALVLSHFPDYFDSAIKDEKKRWKKTYKGLPLGLVYYKPSYKGKNREIELAEEQEYIFNDTFLTIIRRHIGLLTYILWIGILLDVYLEVFHYGVKSTGFLIIIWLVLLIIQIIVEFRISCIPKEPAKLRKRIKYTLWTFQTLLITTILTTLWLLISIKVNAWSRTNIVLMLLISFMSTILFILFRGSRKWFIYFRDEEQEDQKKGLNYRRNPLVDEKMECNNKFKVTELIPLYFLSNQVNYLKVMSFVGIGITVIIVVNNFFDRFDLDPLNPVALIIMYVLIYYAIITISLKHALYYSSRLHNLLEGGKSKCKKIWWTRFYKWVFQSLFVFVALLFVVGYTWPNKMHDVPVIKESSHVDKERWLDSISGNESDKFIIGSYGGGLKANSWNLILLTEILRKQENFLDSTLCISGVSGGAIGIANLTSMIQRLDIKKDTEEWDSIVERIGTSNMLSVDVNGIFLKDLIFKMFPFNLYNNARDRAYDAMKIYSEFTGENGAGLDISMKEYYKNVFDSCGYYPAIIFNTTPTKSKFGVACSVDGIVGFPISIDILDKNSKGESLTFWGAASTTNRFPVASPAARIEKKGYFVDGGYFDNSGLLNAYHFYRETRDQLDSVTGNYYAINIMNDKQSHIKNVFRDILDPHEFKIEDNTGELSSILKGLLALERMPEYAREMIDKDSTIELITICMPELFTPDDVFNTYGIQCTDKKSLDWIEELANKNNDTIMWALQEYFESNNLDKDTSECGVVIPPTGRLLSEEAFHYQMAMAQHHPSVLKNIDKIKSILGN